jgi:hypothetical protein
MKKLLAKNNYLKKKIDTIRILPYKLKQSFLFQIRDKKLDPPPEYIAEIKLLSAEEITHSNRSFLNHLICTYRLLKTWQKPEYVCLAGLFHSIYGTQTFESNPIDFEHREKLQKVIGTDAERLVYYYCIRKENHFFANLSRQSNFKIRDRRNNQEIDICEQDFLNLLEIRLADHLEQMFYYVRPYWFKNQFLNAEPFLTPQAFNSFTQAYQKVL